MGLWASKISEKNTFLDVKSEHLISKTRKYDICDIKPQDGVPILSEEFVLPLKYKERYLFDRNSKVCKKFTGSLPVIVKKYNEFTEFKLNYCINNNLYYTVKLYFRPNKPMAVAIQPSKQINKSFDKWCNTTLYCVYNDVIESDDPELIWYLLTKAAKAKDDNGNNLFPDIDCLREEIMEYYVHMWNYPLNEYSEKEMKKRLYKKGIYF